MAASANLFNRYIWLTDIIYSSRRITREEINRRWSRASINENHESRIPERTFHRWRQEIEQLFHINIICDKPTNSYYIENAEDITSNRLQHWFLNAFAIANIANENTDIQDKILLEEMPSDARFLTPVLDAIRYHQVLEVTYQRFDAAEPHVFTFEAYCVKTFKLRWYMVGRPSDHPDQIRVYALDRVKTIKPTQATYSIPDDFDGKAFFYNCFGIWREDRPAEVIRVKVTPRNANYLRSLPLHHSQKETETRNDYVVFEFFLKPTYDFIQELRTHGSELKVLEPKWLAGEFLKLGEQYTEMYQ